MYGIINFDRIDTAPGAASAFAPPSGWCGNYRELMRDRWKNDPGVRQHVYSVGWMLYRKARIEFRGPYAVEAKQVAEDAFTR